MSYRYHKPKTLDEAFSLKEKYPEARFIAGGTDVMVRIKNRQSNPKGLISLRSIEGLDKIEVADLTRIGAMTTIADLIGHEELGGKFPLLIQAAKELGSVQIRNVATIGGNLCNASPCADTALPLLVYDSRVEIAGRGGMREAPLDKFFVGPGATCMRHDEIMTAILMNFQKPKTKTAFQKKGRVKMDIAVASLAVLAEMDGGICKKARVAAGSVAPVPLRLRKVEKMLETARISPELAARARAEAEAEVTPISDVRAAAEYRRSVIGVYMARAIENLMTGE